MPGYSDEISVSAKLISSARSNVNRYKGMAVSTVPSKALAPQPTGFSQVHSRNTGEGGGAAMSVLLSWHEKVVEIAGLGSVVRVMTDRRIV
jgi:actin related protein 2/3 complex subunit 5